MKAVPLSQKEAGAFVDALHRHHIAAKADKYRIGCVDDDGKLCGVVQVGRPLSRYLDDGHTLEVIRLCTDGTRNACSFLYSRAARIAREMGYSKIITYILMSESGDSLRASGWHLEAENVGGGSWNVPSRPRNDVDERGVDKYPKEKKQRWAKILVDEKEGE